MKSGYLAVIGRANAGKSTLVNVLVGEKVSIVSPKPQTTRDRITGVYYDGECEIAFVDTPGLYKADNLLNDAMQRVAADAVKDVDAVLFVLDGHDGITEKDAALAQKFLFKDKPLIIAITKTDITSESVIISDINQLKGINAEIVPVSARKGKNIRELMRVIKNALPEGELLFGGTIVSDRSEKFMIAEIMREKILLKFDKEIPHGVAIIVNEFSNDGNICRVSLDIICEKPNHKAILIGKGGAAIKEVSSFARADMEKFLGKKVFLKTFVKVEEGWRNSAYLIKKCGYNDQEF